MHDRYFEALALWASVYNLMLPAVTLGRAGLAYVAARFAARRTVRLTHDRYQKLINAEETLRILDDLRKDRAVAVSTSDASVRRSGE